MATGASAQYWETQRLPSVFKHTLLDKYVPQFAGMTASRSAGRRVVFLDGYAGRGRYENGSPGSAERILQIAQRQARSARLAWTCFFVEQDPDSARVLAQVVEQYAGQGVTANAYHGDVADRLPDVLAAAEEAPLFLFLDPCGLGLPYQTLMDLVGRQRAATWPPTEVLFNFSLEAVRRISGHIASRHRNEKSVRRLDAAVGGEWWHDLFAEGVTDGGVEQLVAAFAQTLSRDTTMRVVVTPVRRAPTHKPVYHLIFGTRSNHGVWVFGDSVARDAGVVGLARRGRCRAGPGCAVHRNVDDTAGARHHRGHGPSGHRREPRRTAAAASVVPGRRPCSARVRRLLRAGAGQHRARRGQAAAPTGPHRVDRNRWQAA